MRTSLKVKVWLPKVASFSPAGKGYPGKFYLRGFSARRGLPGESGLHASKDHPCDLDSQHATQLHPWPKTTLQHPEGDSSIYCKYSRYLETHRALRILTTLTSTSDATGCPLAESRFLPYL
jgi:hypothetical protein